MSDRPAVTQTDPPCDGSPCRAGLLALDLDGTVLSPAGHVTPRTRAAIRGAIEAGLPVCIATGRSWWESRGVIAEAGLAGPGVFVGGAIVSDVASGATLAHTRMEPATARELCGHLEDAGVAAMALQDRDHAPVEWLISAGHAMPPSVPEWLAHHGSSFERVAGLRAADHAWTVRVGTVTATPAAGEALARSLEGAMGARVYQHLITVPTTGVSVLEIFDAGVNKWRGIQQVAALLGIDDRSIIAVGDDLNDLHMLRHARVGIAMGNARAEVVAAADMTIGPNADDGLARYLEQLLTTGARLPEGDPPA